MFTNALALIVAIFLLATMFITAPSRSYRRRRKIARGKATEKHPMTVDLDAHLRAVLKNDWLTGG